MSARYCKTCKHNVQEKHLYKEQQCPTCGQVLPKALELLAKRTPTTPAKLFKILVKYTDKVTGELKTVVYTDVSEEYFNKIKYSANNVKRVYNLTKEA